MLDLLGIAVVLYIAIVVMAIAICRAAATEDPSPAGPRIGPFIRR